MHTHLHTCVCVRVCNAVHSYIHACIHTCEHTPQILFEGSCTMTSGIDEYIDKTAFEII